LLRETLAARGAHVDSAEVYRRVPAVPAFAELQALHEALPARPVVLVTSAEVLVGLLDLVRASSSLRGVVHLPLVVPAARVGAKARELGWQGPVTVAATAEDAAMLEASAAARRGASPGVC
jgi:uroporphyrinogen-III synthase